MIKSPETHDPFLKKIHLENNAQSVAHLKNIALKTHFFYFTNCSSSFSFKIRRRLHYLTYIDSDININFLLRAWVICHLHKKCLLSPKTTVNTFRPVLLPLGMTQFTLKLSQHLLLISLRKVLIVNSSI